MSLRADLAFVVATFKFRLLMLTGNSGVTSCLGCLFAFRSTISIVSGRLHGVKCFGETAVNCYSFRFILLNKNRGMVFVPCPWIVGEPVCAVVPPCPLALFLRVRTRCSVSFSVVLLIDVLHLAGLNL